MNWNRSRTWIVTCGGLLISGTIVVAQSDPGRPAGPPPATRPAQPSGQIEQDLREMRQEMRNLQWEMREMHRELRESRMNERVEPRRPAPVRRP